MKVTLNWLKRYVDFDWSPEELAERLTLLGLEVEGVQKLGGEFNGIVVAQVITKDKHPNADKLTVCRVNDGKGERQIVCGAQNFKPGDKVPLILPGASLPLKPGEKEPFIVKVGKIRSVESHGMMCSPQELGLPDQVDGLLLLRQDAKVGQTFAEYLGRSGSDVVYDLEVTPNRPDLNSVIGIAREISAVTGNLLRIPDLSLQGAHAAGVPVAAARRDVVSVGEPPTDAREPRALPRCEDLVAVRIEDAELCPRYVARAVHGVKIGPSPDWLRTTLEKVGIRSINNVVDVTNYVMLETGQPLHAFDYHLIAKGANGKPTIIIRRAKEGEKFTTLDGQEHTLTNEMLLIADEQKGTALAGVMGGRNSEINDQTADVLIESAYFKPTNIRRTSKALGLRTDASYRFERGADIGITDWASARCAQLIRDSAGGQLAHGVIDAFPQPPSATTIALRHSQTNALLGVEILPDQQIELLRRLGLEPVERANHGNATITVHDADVNTRTLLKRAAYGEAVQSTTTFRIPTFRVDLKREADLMEEICRLYGVEKIPATPPRGAIGANTFDALHDQISEARRILTGLGLNEAQGQTLISDAAAKLTVPPESVVLLTNPLSSDMNALRPSLLSGLLDALRHNLHHKTDDVALFEVGRVFTHQNGQFKENRHVAIALTGHRALPFWSGENREAKFDTLDLKGVLEEFLEHFGLRGVIYGKRAESTPLFLESATVTLGGKLLLGEMGQLLPALGRKYDLRDAVFLAELDLDQLLARRNPTRSFKPLPQFPGVRRDVAMIVPESITHDAVLNVVKQARPANLEGVELFDVFRGQHVPERQKSLAYAFTYRHADRTLTDEEVNAAHEKLVEQFKQKLRATIR
jgi:phenylalanyl-tRNA synthetase beta chain